MERTAGKKVIRGLSEHQTQFPCTSPWSRRGGRSGPGRRARSPPPAAPGAPDNPGDAPARGARRRGQVPRTLLSFLDRRRAHTPDRGAPGSGTFPRAAACALGEVTRNLGGLRRCARRGAPQSRTIAGTRAVCAPRQLCPHSNSVPSAPALLRTLPAWRPLSGHRGHSAPRALQPRTHLLRPAKASLPAPGSPAV